MFLHMFNAKRAGSDRKYSLTFIKSLDKVQIRVPQPCGILGEKATSDEKYYTELARRGQTQCLPWHW